MENNSKKEKGNSSLKAIIAVLAMLLVGSFGYMYKMNNDFVVVEKKLTSEKESVINDLQNLKQKYDAAIAERTTLSDELIRERAKVEQLIQDLKKSEGKVISLSKYREEYKKLEVKMKSLIVENNLLKKQNQQLTTERDSTIVKLGEAKQNNDTLITRNKNLYKTIEVASVLSILNLKVETIKERSSGKQIITEKAKRVNKLKVCFTVAENKVAKPGDRTYYIQIIDAKNKSKVLGENKTIKFENDSSLVYSFTSVVKYQNKAADICESLPVADGLEKGTYFVNIFDSKDMVSKISFTLK